MTVAYVLGIAKRHEDGTLTQRAWHIPADLAEFLAEFLGEPHNEAMATAGQASDLLHAMHQTGAITINNLQGPTDG